MPLIQSCTSDPFFPTSIDMSGQETFTQDSFKKSYSQCLAKKIPDFLIGITEATGKDRKIYNIFDGAYLFSNPQKLDPLSNLKIDQIYYFSIKCYTPQAESKDPESVLNESGSFKPHFITQQELFNKTVLRDQQFNNFQEFQNMVVDALNPLWNETKISTYTDREKMIAKISCVLCDVLDVNETSSKTESKEMAAQKAELKETAHRWYICGKKAFQ